MNQVKIETMKQQDWNRIRDIFEQGMESNLATFDTDIQSYEEWDESHRKECRFVVFKDEYLVGWAALSPISYRKAFHGVSEISIYLDKDYQGKGFGKILLKKICKEAKKLGYWSLQSHIMEDNIPSIKLHESCGFRTVGYREKIAKDRYGKWRNTVLMELRNLQ